MDVITNSMDMSLSKLQELVINREAWHSTAPKLPPWDHTESDMTDLIYWLVDGKYSKCYLFLKLSNYEILYMYFIVCVCIYIYIYIHTHTH